MFPKKLMCTWEIGGKSKNATILSKPGFPDSLFSVLDGYQRFFRWLYMVFSVTGF